MKGEMELVRSEVIPGTIEHFWAQMQRLTHHLKWSWTSSDGTCLRFEEWRTQELNMIVTNTWYVWTTSPLQPADLSEPLPLETVLKIEQKYNLLEIEQLHRGDACIEAFERADGTVVVDFWDARSIGLWPLNDKPIGAPFRDFCEVVVQALLSIEGTAPTPANDGAGYLPASRQQKGDFIQELTAKLDLPTFEGILASIDKFTVKRTGQTGALVEWQVEWTEYIRDSLGYITALPVGDRLILKFYRMRWDTPREALEFKDGDGAVWESCGTSAIPWKMVWEIEAAFRELDISYERESESDGNSMRDEPDQTGTPADDDAAEKPWKKIPDNGWDRFALELWHKGYTTPEIAGKISNVVAKTVLNRLCNLRQTYGTDIVPTDKQRRRL